MTLPKKKRRLCVFCGASDKVDDKYRDVARRFGAAAAGHGIGIVYGGCSTGLMGAVADGALAAGGEVIGVLPDVQASPTLAGLRAGRDEVLEKALELARR